MKLFKKTKNEESAQKYYDIKNKNRTTRYFYNHPSIEWIDVYNYNDISYSENGIPSTQVSYSINGKITKETYSCIYDINMMTISLLGKFKNRENIKDFHDIMLEKYSSGVK